MKVTPAQLCARVRTLRPRATDADVAAAECALGTSIPSDLQAVLRFSNGFEGIVGVPESEWYLRLRSTRELTDENGNADFKEQRPELILFAGDGGGEGFFFDPTRPGPPVLMIAFISDWHSDAIDCADSIGEFFERLVTGFRPFKRRTGER